MKVSVKYVPALKNMSLFVERMVKPMATNVNFAARKLFFDNYQI